MMYFGMLLWILITPVVFSAGLYWIGNHIELGIVPNSGSLICSVGSLGVGWAWAIHYFKRKSSLGRRLTIGYGLYAWLVASWVSTWDSVSTATGNWMTAFALAGLINLLMFIMGAIMHLLRPDEVKAARTKKTHASRS